MKTTILTIIAFALVGCGSPSSRNKTNDIDGFPTGAEWGKIDRTFVPGNSIIE